MSVENTDVIDFASIDKDGNAVFTISDHLEWDDANEHLLILQNKLNAYLHFIEEEGNLSENYPKAIGRHIIIRIVSKYRPHTNNADIFLKRTKEILETAGYGFEFRVFKGE